MGLRLQGGIDAKRFQDLVSLQLEEVVNQDAICMLVSLGDLVADRHGIRTTAAGRLRLNAVLSALLC
jgi:coproporphyrinogen III oxidase-like Fe-S oxidoreductase